MKKLKVLEYDKYDDFFCVLTNNGEAIVDRHKFETWLKINDHLDYEINYVENGEIKQLSGALSIEEYWETDTRKISEDIGIYLSEFADAKTKRNGK